MLRCIAAAFVALLAQAAHGHDIPNDVRVQAFVRPEGQRLNLLVRVPLGAMRESDIPVRGPGYLDLPRAGPAFRTAANLWLADNIDVYEAGVKLPRGKVMDARVALAADRSFMTYDEALANLRKPPITGDTDLYWKQQQLDVLLEYPIGSERSEFAIHPRLDRLGLQVLTTVRFMPPGGAERAFELHGDPGIVPLDPRWHYAAWRFVELGFRHILDGTDHLLFIACLVIPFRRLRPLIIIATAFTVAHSITLVAAAFGFAPEGLWFPPLVETLIAASIVYMALENIVGSNPLRRWILAFAFGLVHGFGFAFALRESLQFAGDHIVTALFAFNVGVELGQVAVLVVLVPLVNLLLRFVPERMGTIILSALIAHTAWHWMVDRFADLRKFAWPPLDAAAVAGILRWMMVAIVLAFAVWLANGWVVRKLAHPGARVAEDPHPR